MHPLETQAGSLSSNKPELLPFLYNNLLQKHTMQAAFAVCQSWIIPADIRLGFLNGTGFQTICCFNDERAAIQRLLGIWINPDPTQAVDTGEQIVPPFPLPAQYIKFGCMQVTAEGFTAFPAA
jgi:hypothetical protein